MGVGCSLCVIGCLVGVPRVTCYRAYHMHFMGARKQIFQLHVMKMKMKMKMKMQMQMKIAYDRSDQDCGCLHLVCTCTCTCTCTCMCRINTAARSDGGCCFNHHFYL